MNNDYTNKPERPDEYYSTKILSQILMFWILSFKTIFNVLFSIAFNLYFFIPDISAYIKEDFIKEIKDHAKAAKQKSAQNVSDSYSAPYGAVR